MSAAIAAAVVPFLKPLFDKVIQRIPDPAVRVEVEREARQALVDAEARITEAASSIVAAEITGQSKLQRIWRPVAMLTFLGLILWIGVVAPMFGLAEDSVAALAGTPDRLWSLITIGMGGYIGGRSAEKIVTSLAKGA